MKLILPLSIVIPRKTKEDKVFTLNMNVYRNAHHMVMNQAKTMWLSIVLHADITGNEVNPPCRFIYTVYPANNRKFDLGNVCAAIQKFTDDALIELGIIPDDSYKVIPMVEYRFGGVDKENPRCELEITAIKEDAV
jgi:hypothetical protein